MYGDLLLDNLDVNFLGPAPLDLELLHMITTFHWNALGSTLWWWFCHNNTVSCNEKLWVEQVTPPPPPWGRTRGGEGQRGGRGVNPIAGTPTDKTHQNQAAAAQGTTSSGICAHGTIPLLLLWNCKPHNIAILLPNWQSNSHLGGAKMPIASPKTSSSHQAKIALASVDHNGGNVLGL